MFRRLIKDVRGMTLIDMSIALLVISLMTVPLIQIYNVQRQQSLLDTTRANLDAIEKAMDDYYFNNGRYPCPADLTLGPGNANYGQEGRPCDPAGSANVIVAPPALGILRGGVPFAELQIPMSLTLDGWSHKITYTVTRAQATVVAPAPLPPGVLTFNLMECSGPTPATLCSVITPAVSAQPPANGGHYILVSHGEQGVGAYNENGALVQACPPPGPTFTREAENCNDDRIFWESSGMTTSLTSNANYYDDLTVGVNEAPTRIWTTANNPNNIFAGSSISVGINNPNAQTALDVRGDVRADANAGGDRLCNWDNTNCFTTRAFADPVVNNQMRCTGSSSSGMNAVVSDNTAIANVRVTCSTSFPAATANQTCPGTQRVVGITAGGTITCAP